MDIERFIPEQNTNWYVSYETLYFKKYGSIPLVKKIDGIWFISLDRRATKAVLKLTKRFEDMNQPFFFCDRMTINEKHIYTEDLDRIIKNYLLALEDEKFFNFVVNSDFDYINNLTKFLNLFDCHKTFKNIYDSLKSNHFHKLWIDWYTRKENWQVKNEQIRDYFGILERQIKLNIFFS
jgi:hypothetical protein